MNVFKIIDKILRNSETPQVYTWRHVADTKTGDFYHLDENYNVWTCDCKMPADSRITLCLSQCNHLLQEGEYNDLRRKVAEKRKELNLLADESIEEGLQRIKK